MAHGRLPGSAQVLLPALIVGDDPVNGLGVARNLGRAGIPVHRIGGSRQHLLRSRYIRSQSVVRGLDDLDDDAYLDALNAFGERIGRPAVLFPITDLHVLRLGRLEASLRGGFRSTAAPLASAEILVNKRRFYEAVASFGVDHPATRFPGSEEEFVTAAAAVGYPVYLKPEISPAFYRVFHRKGFVARNPEELRARAAEIVAAGLKVILQEIVPGSATQMRGCAGYRRHGQSVWVCYRRVREFPPGFGSGSLLESCPSFVHETRLLEFLDSIGYEGIFDAEFKLDPRRGAYCLIEINARSWWQNLLPTRSGINVIELAYRYAAGLRTDQALPEQRYADGVKWVHEYNDFAAARAGGMSPIAWWRSLSGRRDFAFLAADDPLPSIAHLASLAGGKARKLLGLGGRGADGTPAPAATGSSAPAAPAAETRQEARR